MSPEHAVKTGHSHVVERLDAAPHRLCGHPCFLGDRNIGRPGREDQDIALELGPASLDHHRARQFMIDRAPIQPRQRARHIRLDTGCQQGAAFLQQASRNRYGLRPRLTFAEDDLRKPLPDRAVMVH